MNEKLEMKENNEIRELEGEIGHTCNMCKPQGKTAIFKENKTVIPLARP